MQVLSGKRSDIAFVSNNNTVSNAILSCSFLMIVPVGSFWLILEAAVFFFRFFIQVCDRHIRVGSMNLSFVSLTSVLSTCLQMDNKDDHSFRKEL